MAKSVQMARCEPVALFEYARRFADRNEAAGRGTKFPTVRNAAKRFRCTQADVVDAVEDGSGMRIDGVDYFALAVGVQIGMGGGWAGHDSVGDYEIEAYRTQGATR